ncbi:MAG: TonB-dependent receptor [Bacteroidia bacterium]|nr:TonB-dependent receptor [Bacteroidia bacterium]
MRKVLQSTGRLLATMVVLCLVPVALWAQDRTVSGSVTAGDDNSPLSGATVIVKGTTRGVFTDGEGKFTIAVPDLNGTLVFSYLGFATTEVPLTGRTNITVAMERENVSTEEVIITGYTAQSRRDVTGAVSSISSEDLLAAPVTGVEQALQGRAPGVQVITEGGPGGAALVRIRGFSSIGNNNPLYIIDGVPSGSGLNIINPNDIESVQVLKDASTASIYGARASNGVVIITTKKGKYGFSNVSFDSYYGIQSASKFPDLLNPTELANLIWTARKNAGDVASNGNPSHPQYGNGASPVLPAYIFPQGASQVDESTYNRESNPITRANTAGTDWFDEIFDPAPIQNYQLTASAGNQTSRHSISANYFRQDGILKFTNYERYSIRANSETRVKDWLTVGENFTYSVQRDVVGNAGRRGEGTVIANATRMPAIVPLYDIGGNYGGAKGAGLTNAGNPYAGLERGKDNAGLATRAFGNAYAAAEIMKDLIIKTSLGINYGNFNGSYFTPRNFEAAEVIAANTLFVENNYFREWTWSNTIQYKLKVGDLHRIEVLAGTEAIESKYRYFSAGRSRFFSDDVNYRFLNAGEAGIANGGFGSESSLFSVFGKVDYSLKDSRYLVSFTVRRDGSSRFGESNRFGVFPAVSAGWRISDEAFMDNVPQVSTLKLRAGYGSMGSQNSLGEYATFSTFGPSIGESFYDITGSNSSLAVGYDQQNAGNPNLKWEAQTTLNAGIDLGLFNERISANLDLYDRTTTDMLYQPSRPATAGVANNPFVNIGEMNNRGIDFALGINSKQGKDFTYNVSLNLSVYKNRVVKLNEDVGTFIEAGGVRGGNTARTEAGLPMAMFYGHVLAGDDYFLYDSATQKLNRVEGTGNRIFQTAEEVAAHPDAGKFATPADGIGRFQYVDINGDGVIDAADRTFIGSPHPDLIYGLNTSFGYKNIDLTIFLQGTLGNDIYNYNLFFEDFFSFQQNQSRRMLEESWTPENTDGLLPKLDSRVPNEENRVSSYFIQDGSFLRVKNLQVGYTLPASLVSKAKIDKLRVYVQGTNLLTVTKYTGLDPELGPDDYFGRGGDLSIGRAIGDYPVARSVVFGVSLGL